MTTTATTSSLTSVAQSQLESLDDTDCYATAWQRALEKYDGSRMVVWGGRGRGGRGLARRTFQPNDCVVPDLRLEYLATFTSRGRILLKDTTLKLQCPGLVYAVIGPNGSGKSTLLRRIDAGKIPGFSPHISTVYVPQEDEMSLMVSSSSIKVTTPMQLLLHKQDTYLQTESLRVQQEIHRLEESMDRLDLSLEQDQLEMEDLSARILALEDALSKDTAAQEKAASEALEFVGINETLAHHSIASLSPGQRRRLLLAVPLVCPSDLILLDEPTNGLDIQGLLMLRRWMEFCEAQSSILMVSHDRDLMDDVADFIIAVSKQELFYSPGNYSDYIVHKEQTNKHQVRQAMALEKRRDAQIKTLENLKKQPTPKRGGARKKAKQIESHRKKMERRGLEKDDKGHRRTNQKQGSGIKPGSICALDASKRKNLSAYQLLQLAKHSIHPPPDKTIQFVFRKVTSQWDQPVILAQDVGHGFGVSSSSTEAQTSATPSIDKVVEDISIPIIKKDGYIFDCVDLCIEEGKTYCIVGSTASGKSTLLQILAKRLSSLEGTVQHALNLDVAWLDQRQVDDLVTSSEVGQNALSYLASRYPTKTEQAIRGELNSFGLSPQQVTTEIQFLSGGERSRLCLAAAMLGDPQVLFLDEPTSHLDVESVEALVYGLEQWNGTVVMVSHDTSFVRSLNPKCYALLAAEGKLRRVEGGIDIYLRSAAEQPAREAPCC